MGIIDYGVFIPTLPLISLKHYSVQVVFCVNVEIDGVITIKNLFLIITTLRSGYFCLVTNIMWLSTVTIVARYIVTTFKYM